MDSVVEEIVRGSYRSMDTEPHGSIALAFHIFHARCPDDTERGSRIPCTWDCKCQPLDPHGNLAGEVRTPV